MATVYADGGYGYAATADRRPAGSRRALERARATGRAATASRALFDTRPLPRPAPRGRLRVAVGRRGASRRARDWFDLLMRGVDAPPRSTRASSTGSAGVEVATATHRLVTSEGGDVVQRYRFMLPGLAVDGARGRRHADAHAQRLSRHLPAGRRRGARALRLRRRGPPHRRGGARARARAELPDRDAWTCCSRPTR